MPAKRYKVNLFPEERDELQRLVFTGNPAASKRRRAQILLKADQSPQGPAWTDEHICAAFDVGQLTVSRTRKALVLEGVEAALQRKPRGASACTEKTRRCRRSPADRPGVLQAARRLCQVDHATLRRCARLVTLASLARGKSLF